MEKQQINSNVSEVRIIPGPIEYTTLGLSVLAALGTVYLVIDASGILKKKQKKKEQSN